MDAKMAGERIVRVVRIEDGSTTGERVLIDEHGGVWRESWGGVEATGERRGTLIGNRMFT